MNAPIVAVYAEDELDPACDGQAIATRLAELRAAGFDTLYLGSLHLDQGRYEAAFPGDLRCNDSPLFSGGRYIGDPGWPRAIESAIRDHGMRIGMSFGGPGHTDFHAIRLLHARHGTTFAGTELRRNFTALRAALPSLDSIELCCEDTYDLESFAAFCAMLVELGFGLCFRPSMFRDFWVRALDAVHARHPGSVHRCHLQCHGKGSINAPGDWAGAFESAIDGFDADGFVVVGEWAENTPQEIRDALQTHARDIRLGGGAVWSLERMTANGTDPRDYADALREGLREGARHGLSRA